jgi:alpha-mannosidase
VDIPFGVEERNLTDEPYAATLPEGFQNIERHRENQFWARSWASVRDGERGITLITADGDKYWTWNACAGQLRHILLTPIRDADSGWEAWVTKERLALGWHEFRHRLVFHGGPPARSGDWKESDLCGASDRLRVPLQVVKPLGPAPALLTPPELRRPQVSFPHESRDAAAAPAVLPGLSLTPSSVRLSAFYHEPEGYVLRLYESSGEAVEATVSLPASFREALRTDFNLEPLDAPAHLAGDQLTLPLRPWEIATVLLKP